jgi:putative spermidine/putrescine transport system permease protein
VRRPTWGLWLFLLVSVLPIIASLIYVALYSVGATGLLSRGVTWAHWSAVLTGAEVWRSLALSTWVAGAVVVVSAGLGLAIALWQGPALDRGVLGASLYVPLAIPAIVAALMVFLLFGATGWMPRLLLRLGWIAEFDDKYSLVQDRYGMGLIAAHVFFTAPFLALFFRGLQRSERLDELARVAAALGASARQTLWSVSIPVLLRRGSATLALVFVLTLGSFEIPLLLGRQSPQMISVLVWYKYARFDLTVKPQALAIALIYSVFVGLSLAWLFRRRAGLERLQS